MYEVYHYLVLFHEFMTTFRLFFAGQARRQKYLGPRQTGYVLAPIPSFHMPKMFFNNHDFIKLGIFGRLSLFLNHD